MRNASDPPRAAEPDREELARRGLPQLLYSPEEVGAMFGRKEDTIRRAAFALKCYRLEPVWSIPGRRTLHMRFGMREIQELLDYFAPPVERLAEILAVRKAIGRRRRGHPGDAVAPPDTGATETP